MIRKLKYKLRGLRSLFKYEAGEIYSFLFFYELCTNSYFEVFFILKLINKTSNHLILRHLSQLSPSNRFIP